LGQLCHELLVRFHVLCCACSSWRGYEVGEAQEGEKVEGELTAPQEPHDLAAPSEAAPHLGQLDPCMVMGCVGVVAGELVWEYEWLVWRVVLYLLWDVWQGERGGRLEIKLQVSLCHISVGAVGLEAGSYSPPSTSSSLLLLLLPPPQPVTGACPTASRRHTLTRADTPHRGGTSFGNPPPPTCLSHPSI